MKNPKNTANYFILLDVMFLVSLVIAEVFYITDNISSVLFLTVLKTLLVGFFGILFTQVILIKVYPYTKQKMKVLWRIPIIASLVGYYFEYEYFPVICAGYWFISFLALAVKWKDYRILISHIVLYVFPIVGMIYIEVNRLWILNIILIALIFLSRNIWNISIINMKFKIEGSESV
jgi:hypothetical protein